MTSQGQDDFSPYRSDGKLYGFVCIVTGATQPVGRAIVNELAAHGAACVYACSSGPKDDYTSIIEEVKQSYPSTKVVGYPFKLANEEDTLTLIDDVLNTWGRLDVWVTSSGVLGPTSISETTPTNLYQLFEAHSMAPFFALKYAPPAMAKTSPKGNYPNAAPKSAAYGSIIVVSSIASQVGGSWGPGFTMCSHAALGVVRAGVVALKGSGVRINCISPGQIDGGGQSPAAQQQSSGLERVGTPIEVARVAGFLASSFSSYMTGANLVVDGGSSVIDSRTVPN